MFVEAVVDPVEEREGLGPRTSEDGVIEVAMGGIVVRVGRGAEETTITAVLRALKGVS